jgi:hypothetical protein
MAQPCNFADELTLLVLNRSEAAAGFQVRFTENDLAGK